MKPFDAIGLEWSRMTPEEKKEAIRNAQALSTQPVNVGGKR